MKKKYSGELNTPLEKMQSVNSLTELGRESYAKRNKEEYQKVKLLLQHYDIDSSSPDPFFYLALELARDHIPGFNEKPELGAKKKWAANVLRKLKLDVEMLLISQSSDAKSVAAACRILCKNEYWGNFIRENESNYNSPNPSETLRKAYYIAKKLAESDRKFID